MNPIEVSTRESKIMNRGDSVANFVLKKRLGEGGMGEVWLAFDHQGHPFALKFCKFEQKESARQRFIREVEIQGQLLHPHIVRVYKYIEKPPCIVMQYIDGKSLEDVLQRRGALPLDECMSYLEQAADALSYAHSKGVIHRDIKPGNLLLQADGTLMVMDFGIAKDVHTHLTRTGMGMGTADYIAPEQIRNAKNVDARADIYSLALTFYELVTGRHPFEEIRRQEGDTDYLMKEAHLLRPVPDPRCFRQDLPEKASQVVLWALNKNPEERPQSMAMFLKAMKNAMSPPTGTFLSFGDSNFAFPKTKPAAEKPAKMSSSMKEISGERFWIFRGTAVVVLVIAVLSLFFFIRKSFLSREYESSELDCPDMQNPSVHVPNVNIQKIEEKFLGEWKDDSSPNYEPNALIPWRGAPIVVKNQVLFGTRSGALLALDAKTLELKQRFQTGNEILGAPLVVNDNIFLGSKDKCYRILSFHDFSLKNMKNPIKCFGGYITATPILFKNKVVFSTWSRKIVFIDINKDTTDSLATDGVITAAPAVDQSFLYFASVGFLPKNTTQHVLSKYDPAQDPAIPEKYSEKIRQEPSGWYFSPLIGKNRVWYFLAPDPYDSKNFSNETRSPGRVFSCDRNLSNCKNACEQKYCRFFSAPVMDGEDFGIYAYWDEDEKKCFLCRFSLSQDSIQCSEPSLALSSCPGNMAWIGGQVIFGTTESPYLLTRVDMRTYKTQEIPLPGPVVAAPRMCRDRLFVLGEYWMPEYKKTPEYTSWIRAYQIIRSTSRKSNTPLP